MAESGLSHFDKRSGKLPDCLTADSCWQLGCFLIPFFTLNPTQKLERLHFDAKSGSAE